MFIIAQYELITIKNYIFSIRNKLKIQQILKVIVEKVSKIVIRKSEPKKKHVTYADMARKSDVPR